MKSFVIVVVLLICSMVWALEVCNPWDFSLEENLCITEIPTEPTFYKCFGFGNWLPSGGGMLFMVSPGRPLSEPVDTTFSSRVLPFFYYRTGDIDTAFFEDIFTGTIMDEIPVSSDMGLAVLRAEGDGYISVGIRDTVMGIDKGLPALFKVVPSGSLATRWSIIGPEITRPDDPFSMFWAVASDDSGKPVPDFIPGFIDDRISIRVVGESIEDSSAYVVNPFESIPLHEVTTPSVYSMFFFYIRDEQSEIVRLVAEGVGDTLEVSDTFEVRVVTGDTATAALAIKFDGLRAPVNHPSTMTIMSFLGDGPDFSNSGTKVRLSAVDLHGTESVTIEPTGWQTLAGGIAGVSFTDTEVDTLCIFMVPEADSLPKLETPIWTPVQVVPEDWALRFEYEGPVVAISGDTAKLVVNAINGLGETDTSAHAFFTAPFYGDFDGSATVIDSISGDSWGIDDSPNAVMEMIGGRHVLYVTENEEEELSFEAYDAEMLGLFDQGEIGFREEHPLVFEEAVSGGAVMYVFQRGDGPGIYSTDDDVLMTVTARTGSEEIDSTYNDSAAVGATGDAEVNPEIIHFNRGIATFIVRDTVAETVEIDVSGVLLPDNISMRFLEPGTGGILLPLDIPNYIPVNAYRTLRVAVMNFEGVVGSYSGWITIDVIDPNDNGSINAADSVYISGGIGSIEIRNTDAEWFTLEAEGEPEIGDLVVELESRALLLVSMPYDPVAGAIPESLVFAVTDTAFSPYAYSGTVEVSIDEDIDNGSVSYNDEIIISGGYGIGIMENTEQETVDVIVTIPSGQFLYMDEPQIDEYSYLAGKIYYRICAIDERKMPDRFELGPVVPNPFNSSFSIDVSLPEKANVKLDLYNIDGIKTRALIDKTMSVGIHTLYFNASELPSSIYLIKGQLGDQSFNAKAILLK